MLNLYQYLNFSRNIFQMDGKFFYLFPLSSAKSVCWCWIVWCLFFSWIITLFFFILIWTVYRSILYHCLVCLHKFSFLFVNANIYMPCFNFILKKNHVTSIVTMNMFFSLLLSTWLTPSLWFAYLKAPRVNDVVTFDFYTMKPSRKEDFTKVYAHVYFAFWLFLL